MRIKSENSLLILLMAIATFVIFLPLDSVELFPDENRLLQLALSFSESGIEKPFSDSSGDFAASAYAYLISVGRNVFCLPDIYAVRLPSAAVVWLLSVGMFRFRGEDEKMKYAFLASLIFMSSYTVSALAYHANPFTLTTLFLIATLAALYHLLKRYSRTKMWTLIVAASFTTLFFGLLAPLSVLIVGVVFSAVQREKRIAVYLRIVASMAAATVLAYILVAFVANDSGTAERILGIGQITSPIAEYSRVKVLALQLLSSIFPWSIPIIVAFGWIAFNVKWVKERFLSLSLLKQFGAILFVIALPFITSLNGLSLILMLVVIYFNAPLISHFLLSQTNRHFVTWRITGSIFAVLITILSGCYIAALVCGGLTVFGVTLRPVDGLTFGASALLVVIFLGIYSLTRNQRTIRMNDRYLYNIVILYMVAQVLYKTYINPYMILPL